MTMSTIGQFRPLLITIALGAAGLLGGPDPAFSQEISEKIAGSSGWTRTSNPPVNSGTADQQPQQNQGLTAPSEKPSIMAGCERIEGLCTAFENVAFIELATEDERRARHGGSAHTGQFRTAASVFIGLQVSDLYLTDLAISSGAGREGNPLMGLIGQQAAIKVAVTAGTIYMVSKIHQRRPKAATITLWVMNGLMAGVVANNYRIARR